VAKALSSKGLPDDSLVSVVHLLVASIGVTGDRGGGNEAICADSPSKSRPLPGGDGSHNHCATAHFNYRDGVGSIARLMPGADGSGRPPFGAVSIDPGRLKDHEPDRE
jgi:hypothetical protein